MKSLSKCKQCGKRFQAGANTRGIYCSQACYREFGPGRGPLSEEDALRSFWSRVDRSGGPDACWPYTGARTVGYGSLRFRGKTWYGHRLSYLLAHGSLPTVVMHTCDNPPCCNPVHLVGGTHADNTQDAKRKGRLEHGERHHNSKLTSDKVLALRADHQAGLSYTKLSVRYGVAGATVADIVRRRTWSHI